MKQGLAQFNVFMINGQAGETVPLAVGTTSASVTFFLLPQSANNYDVLITNAGAKTAFFGFGIGSATAQLPGTGGTTNATPILAGATYTWQKSSDASKTDTCAAIVASGTTQIYFTSIQGS